MLRLERNLGFAGGCNAGAAATTAPLLFFLNPDARPAPGCLDALRAAADAHPDWGAWQALVALPGGAEVNTRGGEVHWLGVGWSGGYGEPVARLVATTARSASRRARRSSCGAARGTRRAASTPTTSCTARTSTCRCGCGSPAGRSGSRARRAVEHDYEFAKGEQKWFLLERNRWTTVLGAYPRPLLAALLPALLLAELAFVAVAARGGWLGAKLRAQAAVLRGLPAMLRRRAARAGGRRRSARASSRAR